MLSVFNITQTGQNHLNRDTPCQDYSKSIVVECGGRTIILAAAADGVGSCIFSKMASEIAVEKSVAFIKARLAPEILNHDDQIEGLIRDSYDEALKSLLLKAEELEESIFQFDTTLTCTIYDGANLWYGHVGDDGIVTLYHSGKYELITKRHKGDEYNSVVPLRRKEIWQFGKAKESVASFVIMTDGLLDRCVDTEAMNNRIYFPFLSPVLSASPETDKEVAKLKYDWEEFLAGIGEYQFNIRHYVMDDLTLVAGINSDAVKNIDLIEFDNEQWDRDSLQRKEELEKSLYKKNLPLNNSYEMDDLAEADIKDESIDSDCLSVTGGMLWSIKDIVGAIALLGKLAGVVKARCSRLRGALIK